MTFNIRGALNDDGPNRWPERADLNVRTILRHAPDLIGFQELHPGNLETYRVRLPGYHHVLGPPYDNTPDEYHYPSIFWNPQRLDLLESGGFWLSQTPERHSGAWNTDCIRSATWARLAWREAGLKFIHLNTHLDHISEWARVEGAKLILEWLEPARWEGLPVVVTGDFNCMPDSAAHLLFMDAGFQDTYTAAGYTEPRYTYHGFQGKAFTPWANGADRMDWILIRDGQQRLDVVTCEVVDDAEPPVYPSDHYPVVAVIQQRLNA
jgi:endonuclease/exonuclease/phosphatase family metal-dependent hydrolase